MWTSDFRTSIGLGLAPQRHDEEVCSLAAQAEAFRLNGDLSEAERLLHRAVNLAVLGNDLDAVAMLQIALGDLYAEGFDFFGPAEAEFALVSSQTANLQAAAYAFVRLCNSAIRDRDEKAALDCAREAIGLSREGGWDALEALALEAAGMAEFIFGDTDRAILLLEDALSIQAKRDDPHGQARAWVRLAWIQEDDVSKATECYCQALDFYRKTQDQEGQGQVLRQLAKQGSSYADRAKMLRKAISLLRAVDAPEVTLALEDLGELQASVGRTADALVTYRQAFLDAKDYGLELMQIEFLHSLGLIHVRRKEFKLALETFLHEAARARLEGYLMHAEGALLCAASCCSSLAEASATVKEQIRHLKQSVEILEELDDRRPVASMLLALGSVYLANRRIALGLEVIHRAAFEYRTSGNDSDPQYLECMLVLAEAYLERLDYRTSEKWFEKSLRLSNKIGDQEAQVRAYVGLIEVLDATDQPRQVVRRCDRFIQLLTSFDDASSQTAEWLTYCHFWRGRSYFDLGSQRVRSTRELKLSLSAFEEERAVAEQHGLREAVREANYWLKLVKETIERYESF